MSATVASSAAAQGGWRQWDVHLRGGARVEANPLGAPDDSHLAISVGGMEGHDSTIARARVDYIAAQTTVGARREAIPGATLPPAPTARVCEDVIVRRDGRRTSGRVALTRIEYSSGVVSQRGAEIALDEIAYIKFADAKGCAKKKRPRRTP